MGATVQQRSLAGFFVFLSHASHRCSNGQRSRRLALTLDALLGESLIKGKPCWTKWAASRLGLATDDWAGPWMQELSENGMPGFGFLILAPNSALNGWLRRPARYADFSRAFHLLLMIYGGESPNTVIDYTPHGCRHVQVTAATQLASQGLMSDAAIEVLGHWEKGSKMPRLYDSSARVTELATRKTVLDAFRSGWRPASDGNLPAPATPAASLSRIPGTPTPMHVPSTPVAAPGAASSNISFGYLTVVKSKQSPQSCATKDDINVRFLHLRNCGATSGECKVWSRGQRSYVHGMLWKRMSLTSGTEMAKVQ